jgi:hypothetical protein
MSQGDLEILEFLESFSLLYSNKTYMYYNSIFAGNFPQAQPKLMVIFVFIVTSIATVLIMRKGRHFFQILKGQLLHLETAI